MSREALAEHFDDMQQQRLAAGLGMWGFLATEVLFFGVLFASYIVYRMYFPQAYLEASAHLYRWLGATNTAVLLASSFTMALAVHAAATDNSRASAGWLAVTVALGAAFMGIKAVEYYLDYKDQLVPVLNWHYEGAADERHVKMFAILYFVMTGLHALHVTVGVGLLSVLAVFAWRHHYSAAYYTPVEMSGLYWHFVDIVWIFLFPLLYLGAPT